MTLKTPLTRSIRILFALFLTLGVAASISASTQRSALAATGCTVGHPVNSEEYDISGDCNSERVADAHTCQVIGTSTTSAGTTQAVECADIYVTDNSSAQEIWGEGKFYCQGVYVQCLGMNVQVWMSASSIGSPIGPPAHTFSGSYKCNPSVGACPNGMPAYVATGHYTQLGHSTCFNTYSWEPAGGDIISVNGASSAFHSTTELDSVKITLCVL